MSGAEDIPQTTFRSENCPSCPDRPEHKAMLFTPLAIPYERTPRPERLRRFQRPSSLIRPDTALRIWRETPGNAWDVITARQLAPILDPSLSRLAINDWEYARYPDRPPLEESHLWSTGRGSGRVIRKDRAIAWAMTGGETVRHSNCWELGARNLERLGFPGLKTLADVEACVLFLVDSGAIQRNFRWRFPYVPWLPYSGPSGLHEWSDFGRRPDYPVGWVGPYFELPDDD